MGRPRECLRDKEMVFVSSGDATRDSYARYATRSITNRFGGEGGSIPYPEFDITYFSF